MHQALSTQNPATTHAGCLFMPVAAKSNYRLADAPDSTPTQALSPVQAYAALQHVLATGAHVAMTGVRGPGDALADAATTLAYLHMVRQGHPHIRTSLTTIGLGGQEWAEELGQLGVERVTLLVDTISPQTADQLYAWVRPGNRTLPRAVALDLLIRRQAEAVQAFAGQGLEVSVLTTVRPGVNDREVGIIARAMAALGARSMHVCLADGVEDLALLTALRAEALEYLPDSGPETDMDVWRTQGPASRRPLPSGQRPFVAVTSSDASVVDIHLGQASQFLIYGPQNGTVCLIGTRPAPAAGSGPARWEGVAEILSDCMYLLTASAGPKPREALAARGLTVVVGDGGVDGLVDGLFGGNTKPRKK